MHKVFGPKLRKNKFSNTQGNKTHLDTSSDKNLKLFFMLNLTLLQREFLANLVNANQTLYFILQTLAHNLDQDLWPRLIGGCVRDALLGIKPYDIDIATPLNPEKVMNLFPQAKLIPIGISFGTIKMILHNQECEITTLRKDFGCDGRHTLVEFTNDFQIDAKRRDFTINAISYCPFRDKLFDYFEGIKHLQEKKVLFIGDPKERIQEDYLRIMRFFRFSAKYANAIDQVGYEQCAKYAQNLSQISCERIKIEFDKILVQDKKIPILSKMLAGNVLQTILPELTFDLQMLEKSSSASSALNSTPSLAMNYASLLHQNDPVALLTTLKRQKFPKTTINSILNLLERISNIQTLNQLQNKLLVRHYKNYKVQEYAILAGCINALPIQDIQNCIDSTLSLKREPMPINGLDLVNFGYKGQAIGIAISHLEQIWAQSRFTLSSEDLIKVAKNFKH